MNTIPHNLATPDFEIYFDMSKAIENKSDGKVWVSGIASDESEDLDGEIIKAAAYPNSIAYLNKFGKFNWNHGGSIIGDITEAKIITPEDAKSRYGVDVKGHSVEVKGWVMPLSARPDNAELKEAHAMLKSGSKLGFSMQGFYGGQRVVRLEDGREAVVSVPSIVHQVAVCPQPKNSNAACFVKSLAKVLLPETGEAAHDETRGEVDWPVVICSGGVCRPVDDEFGKSIAMGGAPATNGTTGGDAMKLESLTGPSRKSKCKCGGSHEHDDEDNDDDGANEVEAALKRKKDARKLRKSINEFLDIMKLAVK